MASQAIGIDIGTHAIKIAVLQKKGATTKATRLYRSKLAGDTDVERIQGALRRAGIRRSRLRYSQCNNHVADVVCDRHHRLCSSDL